MRVVRSLRQGGAPSCSQVRLEPLGLEEPSCLHIAIQLPSLSCSQSVSLFPSLFLCQCSLCLPLSPSLSLFLSSPPSLSVFLHFSVCLCFPVSLYVFLCVSISVSLSLSLLSLPHITSRLIFPWQQLLCAQGHLGACRDVSCPTSPSCVLRPQSYPCITVCPQQLQSPLSYTPPPPKFLSPP